MLNEIDFPSMVKDHSKYKFCMVTLVKPLHLFTTQWQIVNVDPLTAPSVVG